MANPHYRLRRSRKGAALLFVLFFIMLLSIVVVAFLTQTLSQRQSSNNSFNQAKVDELALSALDIITGDLKQEVVNGSTVVAPVPANPAYPTIYKPNNNADVIPTQNWPGQPTGGAQSTVPNLIRISSTTSIASPGVDHLASAVSSTATSLNGRSVSLARWNQHYLIPCPASPSDSTPDTASNFTAPSWVYVTTQGPAVIPVPTTTVLGRYAYAIYNEGGLLDVNVAGYPSNQTPTQIGGKCSSLAYSDLSQLTDPSGNVCFTTSQIDQLVGWRNYASATASGSFPSITFATSSPTNYYNNFAFSTNSFMKVSGFNGLTGTPYNGNTDQACLSRQELLNLQKSLGFSVNALQFLGTFSREVNAPTFYYPATAAATTVPAAPTATTANTPIANSINLNILTLRMAKAGTAPDGFTWNVGDPVVPRRFPLGRLSLISDTATNTSTTSAIYKYFGLYRSASNQPWVYTGSDGSTTAATSIKTLDQVAAAGREPNFFELLKAAMHRDSVGVWLGQGNPYVGNDDLADNQPDLHILRIGANAIDQVNPDSYPRTIEFAPAGTMLYAYGIEDLPYISAVTFIGISNTVLNNFKDTSTSTHTIQDQVVPVLWNPHRVINQTTGVPTKIQLYLTGKTAYILNGGYNDPSLIETTYNDTLNYGANTAAARYNEMGQGGFDVPANEQNSGSITIDQTQFSSFTNPNLILSTPGGSVVSPVGTGAYGPLANSYSTGVAGTSGSYGVMGLTLVNQVYGAGRQAVASDFLTSSNAYNSDLYFDGYFSTRVKSIAGSGGAGETSHHFTRLGTEGMGVNIVLRYLGSDGVTWHVYDAFASNEADPNGNINTNYDAYGICLRQDSGVASDDGVFQQMFGAQQFPPYFQIPTLNPPLYPNPAWFVSDSNWNTPGVTLSTGAQARFRNNANGGDYYITKSDPRTARFGIYDYTSIASSIDPVRDPSLASGLGMSLGYITPNAGYVTDNAGFLYPGMLAQNSTTNGGGTYAYDWDPGHTGTVANMRNGVVRPGDDYFTGTSGLPGTSGPSGTNNIYQQIDARPIILHRPFASVGELGYVYRDMPFKSLDMSSSVSVDAALLDYFTVDAAETPLVAGKVDINTRQPQVLKAILNGSFRMGDPTNAGGAGIVTMGPKVANAVANNIIKVTSASPSTTIGPASTGPLMNKAELVTRLGNTYTTSTIFDSNPGSGYPATATDTVPAGTYPSIKTQREAPIRALADVANTRTWNLLIDVVAQTGQYPTSATGLSQFVVTGERRYWLHVAIDRYTGKVVDQQLEAVYE